MQMLAGSAEYHLEDSLQIGDRRVAADEDPAPDQRTDAAQGDTEGLDDRGGGSGRRTRCGIRPLCGSLPHPRCASHTLSRSRLPMALAEPLSVDVCLPRFWSVSSEMGCVIARSDCQRFVAPLAARQSPLVPGGSQRGGVARHRVEADEAPARHLGAAASILADAQ